MPTPFGCGEKWWQSKGLLIPLPFYRFPPLAALRFIQEAACMTSRREKEDQQNHGRTESYGPAIYSPASNNPGFAPHDSVLP